MADVQEWPSAEDATSMFGTLGTTFRAGMMMGGKNKVTLEPDPAIPQWGDQFDGSVVFGSGKPVGWSFLARKGATTIRFSAFAKSFDTARALSAVRLEPLEILTAR